MTTTEYLSRFQEIEGKMKSLTGTDGWFLAEGANFPKKEAFAMVACGCDMDTLQNAAQTICANLNYFIDGIDHRNMVIRITHGRHYGD
jgi:hypothetical protein